MYNPQLHAVKRRKSNFPWMPFSLGFFVVVGLSLYFLLPILNKDESLITISFTSYSLAVTQGDTVLPAPIDAEVNWETEELDDGMIAKALDSQGTLRGFVLLGATAAKQRLALTKLVPDLIPAQV